MSKAVKRGRSGEPGNSIMNSTPSVDVAHRRLALSAAKETRGSDTCDPTSPDVGLQRGVTQNVGKSAKSAKGSPGPPAKDLADLADFPTF